MNTGPDKIDEVVRDWYERQAMSGARVEAIVRQVRGTPVRRVWRTWAVATAAAVILVCGIVSVVVRTQGRTVMVAVATEVATRQGVKFDGKAVAEIGAVEGL